MLKLAGEFGIAESELDARIADQIDLHKADLDAHLLETLPVLLKGGNLLHIPTNAGWTQNVVGSGGTAQYLTRFELRTGTTASSLALLQAVLEGFRIGTLYYRLAWDKKLYVIMNFSRSTSDSEVVARFQIKETTAEGALAAKGIGIRVDNYALKGESYGISLGVVDLGVTLTTEEGVQIAIIHYPASKIEWYVNGVLKGTQSDTAKIPSGQAGNTSQIVASIINGATGGVDAWSIVMQPKIWQER